MLLSEGDSVKYKEIEGVVAFICDYSVSILIKKGQHKAQDVKIVVHKNDFNKITILGEK